MKIKCDFCKTEYNIPKTRARVECAVCGNVWNVAPRAINGALLILSATCALIAVLVFVFVVLIRVPTKNETIAVSVNSVKQIGEVIKITGLIENKTNEIYGVGNLIAVVKNSKGDVIATKKFLPPLPLIEGGANSNFEYEMPFIPDVKRISIMVEK